MTRSLISLKRPYRVMTGMHWWCLLLLILPNTVVLSQWCSSEGCIPSSGCECPSFWTYCNTNDSVSGRCDLTSMPVRPNVNN